MPVGHIRLYNGRRVYDGRRIYHLFIQSKNTPTIRGGVVFARVSEGLGCGGAGIIR